MATRSKKPRKRTAKKPSTIEQAQKAASERRIEADTLRGQSDAERTRLRGALKPTKLEARTDTPMASAGKGVDQNQIAARENVAGKSMQAAAQKIAGLSAPVIKSMQLNAPKNPIADPGLYGVSNAKRAANLTNVMNALKGQNEVQLKAKGKAVYMGPVKANAKIRTSGPERIDPETGKSYTEEAVGDQTVGKDELMSWLTDDAKVQQIKDAANKAGIPVETYNDIEKLWSSVVDKAAAAYSFSGKKVTPWALIQLQGKYAGPNGKPADRVVTTTNIDEMAPETARMMFEQTAMQALGRSPTKAEVDDFIAKAQTIAHNNPSVTKSTQHLGFDGNIESQTNVTTGGGVNDKAQAAALDKARQSEDYASYQAAGNYFPMLFDALKSPV